MQRVAAGGCAPHVFVLASGPGRSARRESRLRAPQRGGGCAQPLHALPRTGVAGERTQQQALIPGQGRALTAGQPASRSWALRAHTPPSRGGDSDGMTHLNELAIALQLKGTCGWRDLHRLRAQNGASMTADVRSVGAARIARALSAVWVPSHSPGQQMSWAASGSPQRRRQKAPLIPSARTHPSGPPTRPRASDPPRARPRSPALPRPSPATPLTSLSPEPLRPPGPQASSPRPRASSRRSSAAAARPWATATTPPSAPWLTTPRSSASEVCCAAPPNTDH